MTALPVGTVTFVFTDIEGSTALWQVHAAVMPGVIGRHDALLKEVIAAHNGVVFRTVGDAVHAAFVRPEDALRAALACQRAVAAEPWPEGIDVRVRMGIHTGAADVQDGEYVGHTLNRVARLSAAGHGGQILLSAATAELVRGALPADVSLRDLGEHRLKDLVLLERIYMARAPDLPSDFPALRTLDAPCTNLPVLRGSLLGRDDEIGMAKALLTRPDVGLVTFTGPGGTGKTSLSLTIGHALFTQFADGVWFVPLASISESSLVPAAITSALGLGEEGARTALEILRDYLGKKQVLLILDNFEQVVEAAPLVAELLSAASGLTVLITSRISLRLREERELPIAPLSLPDRNDSADSQNLTQSAAAQLFIMRAQEVKPSFAVTDENAEAIAEICSRLDGLPLAIELAAARVRVLSPQALLQRLERRLPLLTGGAHDLPARQQTMEAAIAWSYDLLTVEEQVMYRRLSVFAGTFTLEQAEAVCGVDDGGMELLDGLTSMVDKSLIRQEEIAGEARFSMLQTIREYGLARLEEYGEADTLRRRHAGFFADLVGRLERDTWATGPGAIFTRAELALDNVRAALDWAQGNPGDTEICLRLMSALTALWAFRGHSAEGHARAEDALARSDVGQYPDALAGSLITVGAMEEMRGDSGRAIMHLQQSEEILRRIGDRAGLSHSVQWLGMTALGRGDADEALRQFTQSRDLARAENLPWLEATALSFLAEVKVAFGDLDEVRSIAEDAAARYTALRDLWGKARMQKLLAGIAWAEGDLATAHRLCEQAIGPLRVVGEPWNLTRTLTRMGVILFDEALCDDAETILTESLRAWHDMANEDGMILSLAGLAAVAAARGQIDRVEHLFAAQPVRKADRTIGLDTLSSREHAHLIERVHEELGERRPDEMPDVSLEQAVAYALEPR